MHQNIFDRHSWKHDSTQIVITAIIKCWSEKYFWQGLKMFCSVYYQLQVHSKYFCLTVRLECIIPWRSLVTTIYTCCTSIIHLSKKYILFHGFAWKHFTVNLIRQTSLWTDVKTQFCRDYWSQQLFNWNKKYLLFAIRLLWFWNHGMVYACFYIYIYIYICIYCFLYYALFIFLISILIAYFLYIIKKILSSERFFFCLLKPQQLS